MATAMTMTTIYEGGGLSIEYVIGTKDKIIYKILIDISDAIGEDSNIEEDIDEGGELIE